MMKTKGQQQQTPRTTSDKAEWPRPRDLAAQTKSDTCSFGYPSPKHLYVPPTDAERAAEDVERWDGLS